MIEDLWVRIQMRSANGICVRPGQLAQEGLGCGDGSMVAFAAAVQEAFGGSRSRFDWTWYDLSSLR